MSKSHYQIQKRIVMTILFCVLAVSSFGKDAITGATGKGKQSPEEYWLYALRTVKVKQALKVAEVINSGKQKISSVNKKYEEIARKEGIASGFFNEPFNSLDFKLWYDAWFLKNLLKEFGVFDLKDNKSKLKRIFEKVTERIQPIEKEKGLIPWPTGIWVRQFGLCDRQSWLFAELAYQAGFETQVVYLVNPENGQSPHTICEVLIEDDKGKVTRSVADPLNKILLEGKSVAELAADKELMKKIWPGREEWWKSLPNSIFWTPSYPQDFCVKNQLLYEKLYKKLGFACPRFGEDPEQRMLRYKKLTDGNKGFKMGLWYFPFRVLKTELETKKDFNH